MKTRLAGTLTRQSRVLMIILPFFAAFAALCIGRFSFITPVQVFVSAKEMFLGLQPADGSVFTVLWSIRLPRILTALLVGAGLSLMRSPTIILLVLGVLILAVQLSVMCRKEPKLLDIMVSVLPMLTVVLPGLCLISILDTQPRTLQLMLLLFVFASSIGCDTLAYFVGSTVGGPKLCPHISPKKTISGAIGGLAGSVLFMLAVEGCFRLAAPELFAGMPVWWTVLAALVCGVAAQMGDLFASMVKRHCQVKDFGSIFPGHGGMMDRLDSILFTAIVIFCYRAILLGWI
jgi:phosphatidate cytidylyltransferase